MSEFPMRVLSALLVLGANTPEKALSVEELAAKLGAEKSTVEAELRTLVDAGYARYDQAAGIRRVCLTGTGIITASSTYS
jgi:DNA-binding IclR family transcriptional regulator